jgi:hypothetical protein
VLVVEWGGTRPLAQKVVDGAPEGSMVYALQVGLWSSKDENTEGGGDKSRSIQCGLTEE